MKRQKNSQNLKRSVAATAILALFTLSACSNSAATAEPTEEETSNITTTSSVTTTAQETTTASSNGLPVMPTPEGFELSPLPLKRGDNVLMTSLDYFQVLKPEDFTPKDLKYYTFYDSTTFTGSEKEASDLLEAAKNPGLGVRGLHEQGITGSVRVAVIDQNMILDNPEFDGRIVAYKDFGTEDTETEGSMHGLSVASILAGENVGVAPDALVYYASVPTWEQDASYYAEAMKWLLEENEKLPENDKIRIISVSAGPSEDYFKNGEQWTKAVNDAYEAGILVIDCRPDEYSGFVFSSYHDIFDTDNIEKSIAGYMLDDNCDYSTEMWHNFIFAPASQRTVPEEMMIGQQHYRYDGFGGQSWAVPYVAGVAALGFQVKPDMTYEQCRDLLFSTAWTNSKGVKFVDPPAFVDAVSKLK